MAIGRFNFGGVSGGGAPFPIYQQLTEPSKKNGVWIKTANKIKDLFIGNEKEQISQELINLSTPPFSVIGSACDIVNDEIYIFGGTSKNTTAYKYNISTDTYTIIANIPYQFLQSSCVAVGTDIYLFGSASSYSNYQRQAYKYDTLTGVWSALANTPYTNFFGGAVAIGEKIYIFGGQNSSNHQSLKTIYCYDISSNTYTKLADLMYGFSFGGAVAIGEKIYLFCSDNKKLIIYNTIKQSCEEIGDVPFSLSYSKAVLMDNNIYVLMVTEDNANYKGCYKYSLAANEYTRLQDLPYNFMQGCASAFKSDIYLFCNIYAVKIKNILEYEPGLYMFLNLYEESGVGGFALKELYKNISKVWMFNETEKIEKEVYIGDGTSWNLLGGN